MQASQLPLPSALACALLLCFAASVSCAQASNESSDNPVDSGVADSKVDVEKDTGTATDDAEEDVSVVDSSKPDTSKVDSSKPDTDVIDDSSVPDGAVACGNALCKATVNCKFGTSPLSMSFIGCCADGDLCGAINSEAGVGCVPLASVEALLSKSGQQVDCHSQ